jgi:hypothetical protein
MGGGILNARGFFLAAATVVALLLAAGCGSSGSDEVTVQTGSLSKAAFIKKADSICEAARTEFLAKYTNFVEAHKADIGNEEKEKALLNEMFDTLLGPNVEGQIEQISELGAPSAYAPEATSFLQGLQTQLDKFNEDPTKLTATPYPFKKAEDTAAKVGMHGCAESFG